MEIVTIAKFVNPAEAELTRNFLEDNGIRAHISGGFWAAQSDTPIGAVLQVAESDLERAVQLLKKVAKDKSEAGVNSNWAKTVSRIVIWSFLLILPTVLFLAALLSWLLEE